MKVAQLCMLVSLPDDFEGNVDDVLRYLNARPPCTGPLLPPHAVTGVGEEMMQLRTKQWPSFQASIANGNVSSIVVIGMQGDGVSPEYVELDVTTFRPKAAPVDGA